MAIEVVPTEVAVAQTCLLLGVRPEFIRAITRDVQALVTKDSPVRENLRAPRFTFKFDTVAAVSTNGDCSTDPYISFAPQIYTYFGKPGCDFWDKDGALQVGRFANVRSKIDYANILKHYAAALLRNVRDNLADQMHTADRLLLEAQEMKDLLTHE